MVSEKREKDDVVEVIIFEKIFSGLKPIIAITAPASNNEAMIAPMRISVSATRETPARFEICILIIRRHPPLFYVRAS